jgi:eukaryotic-like serine/threonine-protein kinase
MNSAPESILGRYVLVEEIGKGSMGTVHRAHDRMLERDVAIKLMRTGPHVEPEIRQRFYREARGLARLQHPNIVTVYDLGEDEGTAYIAMELLNGVDWRRAMRDRPVSTAVKLDLIVQVCNGMAHAHRNALVHRDIKPSNLFIHEGKHVKILDFGLARLPESRMTLTGRVLGTPNYMAPEQILGEPCTARSDIFSAAIVFFEFLTGVHPFRSALIPRRIAHGEPEQLLEVAPLMPLGLGAAFAKALARDPAARYGDIAEFAAEVTTAAGEVEEPAPVPPPPGDDTAPFEVPTTGDQTVADPHRTEP